jgi:hypothetical protein
MTNDTYNTPSRDIDNVSRRLKPHYPMRPESVLNEEEIREIEQANGYLYPPVTAQSLDKAGGGITAVAMVHRLPNRTGSHR